MTPLDRQIFLAINHGLHCGVNNICIGYATWLGNGWIGFPIAVALLFWLDRDSFWWNIALLAIAGIIGGVALNLIKQAVHAPRPLTVFAPEITAGKVYVNVLFDRLYWNSFPSGHTQTASTIAVVLMWTGQRSSRISRWGMLAIIVVVLTIGISRIYCGAHFPSDVLAGAVVGSISARLCCIGVSRIRSKRLRLQNPQT